MKPSRLSSGEPRNSPVSANACHSAVRKILKIVANLIQPSPCGRVEICGANFGEGFLPQSPPRTIAYDFSALPQGEGWMNNDYETNSPARARSIKAQVSSTP